MRARPCTAVLAVIVAATLGCGSDPATTGDYDGDGISDALEGRAEGVDTDGDGKPDWRDFDSDGDGIADKDEGAADTDGDGTPDFRDLDSDGDGIADSRELGPDFSVVDTDGDGTPDFRDLDSDGDGISDADEREADPDRDGTPSFRDLDSDGDGIPDACEAGDADLGTRPRDTDGDGLADFLDLDSDDDGVGDGDEDANHNCSVDPGESSPTSADTDADGVPDIVEKVAGTDPTSAASTIPKTDFYFVLPYMKNRGTGDLDFSTSVRQADVFFSLDNTGSMEGETDNIKQNLVSSVIPKIGAAIPNVAFGIGRFKDFPVAPHGVTGDRPYYVGAGEPTFITTSTTAVGAAINAIPTPFGGNDVPEAGYEALYQWATGHGVASFGLSPFQGNAPAGIGGAGFRKSSLPIVVQVTDSVSHVPADYVGFTAHGESEVVSAYNAIGARIIGMASVENAGTQYEPRPQLERLAVATKATIPPDANGECPTGVAGATHPAVTVAGVARCPVVFDVQTDGTGLSDLVAGAIGQLVSIGEIDVSTNPVGKTVGEQGEVLPAGTTTATFLKSIRPVAPPPAGATIDGDVFRRVKPGSTVTFRLDAFNDFVPATGKDQLFTIDVQVLGDLVTVLDTRKVYVIVPKEIVGLGVR